MLNIDREFRDFSLKDLGFDKYTCRKCGSSYWSSVYREYCPDRPCSKYDFLFKKYSSVRNLSIDESRDLFIKYFMEKNHGYVDPYPVVAKWRDDLYLTIASIIVFQPLVTDGVVEPPFNPLVIVQPCVRLEDIDNVGLTFGRHMTSFEMGGHHAFNKKDKHVYWIRETIEYSLEFFNKYIGIPIESIVFKESWWEGGGNAGPALEVIVDGLELATLVFMKYKLVNGEYKPSPVYVVDTGYGMERIAWFTRKTPTAYHAVFDQLINKYKEILNIDVLTDDLLYYIVYSTSDKDINSINELESFIVENKLDEYWKKLLNTIALFTTLDHVKTILLLLSNGVVPSNTGEGYLVRLVLRRLLKTLLKTGVEISRLVYVLNELVNKQIEYWSDRYVYRFRDKAEYIYEVISIETRKFIDNITRNIVVVDKLINKKNITLDDLIKIYDSHGIPPEIVIDRAKSIGINISLPSDFYSRIARLHGASMEFSRNKVEELPHEIVEWALKQNSTEIVFHREPYKTSHRSRIIDVYNKYVVFDSTIFYPRSGGQDSDIGYIVYNNEKYSVINVFKIGDVIVHELDRRLEIGSDKYVEQHIDWFRRYRLMKHHTATHILLGVLRKIYGDHVWQAGVEKTIEKARLDVTHYKLPSREEIELIEREVNKIIDQRIDISFKFMDKFSAEKEYGVKIYQGGAVYSPVVRIVEIPGVDVEACFGTHVSNTSEVGGFKIINVDRIQDGVIRFEYIAGSRLSEYISNLISEREELVKIIGLKTDSIVKNIENIVSDYKRLQELVKNYRSILKEYLIRELISKAIDICGVQLIVVDKKISDQQFYKNIVEELSLRNNYLTVMYDEDLVEIAVNPELAKLRDIDLKNTINFLKEKYRDVKGGGKRDHISIKIIKPRDKLKDIIESIEKIICQKE
ncbi:MAG: alanine--tRNA ligase [Desulfurococcaceae archaeon]